MKNVDVGDKRGIYILLILCFCYIMSLIYNKLAFAKISYRILLALFVVFFILMLIGVIAPTISTRSLAKLSIFGRLVYLFSTIVVFGIPVFVMRIGIQGLERIIKMETESKLNE